MKIVELHGQLVDCDTHLYVPPDQFSNAFGAPFVRRFRSIYGMTSGPQDFNRVPLSSVDASNVWEVKHWGSPGSYDFAERMQTLQIMGIDRQILFPDGLVSGVLNSTLAGAKEAARHYNHFALAWAKPSAGRLRPASVLRLNDLGVIEEAELLLAAGAYGFTVYCGSPPAGVSPADRRWDRLWSVLEDAGTPLLLHSGSEATFLDKAWTSETNLDSGPAMGGEGGPFALAMSHLAPKVFLTSLILGGVLERHPRLMIGVLEFMANWLGPLAELLDQSAAFYPSANVGRSTLRPSDYLQRQVRITPFFWEPVGLYIERYGLEDCYVFSSDYPHEEGGVDPVGHLSASISGCSDSVVRKFFVDGGRDLCPDMA